MDAVLQNQAISRALLIVALGDSTTSGAPGFQSPIEAPPDGRGNVESQYAYWLTAMHPNWRVLNHGVKGERTDQIAARFRRDVVPLAPDVLIVIAGGNDIYQRRAVSESQRALLEIYEGAHAAGIGLVIAGSVLPCNLAFTGHLRGGFGLNTWLRHEASACADIVFCDTARAVAAPDRPGRLAASEDGLHPTVEGYRRMASVIEHTIVAHADRIGRPRATVRPDGQQWSDAAVPASPVGGPLVD